MTEYKRPRSPAGQRMVGVHLRVPTEIRDFYMAQDHMSDAMREALRAYMEQQLELIK